MEFFVDNWFWFLLGGTIILMTLIGYIAEKTDFGRKDMPKVEKVKKTKKEKKKQKELEVEEPKAEVQMALATDLILEEPTVQEPETVNEVSEETDSSFETSTLEEPTNDYVVTSFTEDSVEQQPIENLIGTTGLEQEQSQLQPVLETEEDLTVPFGDVVLETPESIVEEVAESELNYNDVNTPNIDLPDLDSIVTEQDDSDDVWKF